MHVFAVRAANVANYNLFTTTIPKQLSGPVPHPPHYYLSFEVLRYYELVAHL